MAIFSKPPNPFEVARPNTSPQADKVKPPGQRLQRLMAADKSRRCRRDARPLLGRHIGQTGASLLPLLDLDPHQNLPLLGNDVDFAASMAKIAGQNTIAFEAQIPNGQGFGAATGFMSREAVVFIISHL